MPDASAPGDKDHIMSQQVIIFDTTYATRTSYRASLAEREREAADVPALSAPGVDVMEVASRSLLRVILNCPNHRPHHH